MELYAVYLTREEWSLIVDKFHTGDDFDPLAIKILDAIGTIIQISPEYKNIRPFCGACVYRSCCIVRAAVPSCPHYVERS